MFSLNAFIMKTIKGMIGNYPDFQVREYASNWYSKGVITEDNLAEIDVLIENQYIEPPVVEVTETDLTENETEMTETVTEEQEATDETYEYTEDYTETDYIDESEV